MEADYVIVGGGTAGLVVAARLSENPNIQVYVLEAGDDHTTDMDHTIPGFAPKLSGNPQVDWMFETQPQKSANNRNVPLPRGKVLGGSSMINYMQLSRGHKEEYDAWEKLGNPGWNWSTFLDAFKKVETLHVTPSDEEKFGVAFRPDTHGSSGNLSHSYPKWIPSMAPDFSKTAEGVGLKFNPDPFSGDNSGYWSAIMAIEPKKATRASSASAYYMPAKDRKNLTVLTGAFATHFSLAPVDANGLRAATSVTFVQGGETKTISAKKEVILSAGTYLTPKILELSGIGNSKILESHGISTQIDLPTIGENLQEHIFSPVMTEMDPNQDTYMAVMNPERGAQEFQAYQESASGMLSVSFGFTYAFIPIPDFLSDKSILAPIPGEKHPSVELTEEWLKSPSIPHLELVPVPAPLPIPLPGLQIDPAKVYLSLVPALQHPLSRGSVHIKSSNPEDPPVIDLAILEDERDAKILAEGLKYARKMAATGPLAKISGTEILPGPSVQTDEELIEYNRKASQVIHHPIGSAAMLPKEKGGVVDPSLKVYGTSNLRVVDASIFPVHISAHTQLPVYAIGEIAADIIKKEAV